MEDVIVVGAGPTGLWAAAELALAGISTIILERSEERSPHSKALGIHARTLEHFEMRGLVDKFISEGRPVPMWHYGMLPSRIDLRSLDTSYPYMLALPQRRTEELLERRALSLGVRILRGHEVIGLQQDEGSATLQVRSDKGVYSVSAKYVIGADGSRSVIRELAEIPFPGTEGRNFGFVGEVFLDNPPEEPAISCNTDDGGLIVLPLGGGKYRFAGYDAHRQASDDELTIERLQELTSQFLGRDFGMRDASWLTRFSDRTKLARNYRRGRVFLAGDAAHISWPAGGVGLNVGIQDAMNLSWKMALAMQDESLAPLLDSYNEERWPVGKDLINHTLAQGALITSTTVSGMELRNWLSSIIATTPAVMSGLAMKLSGLEVDYRPANDPQAAGQRVPNLKLADGRDLFSVMTDGKPVRLVRARHAASEPVPAEFNSVKVHELAPEPDRGQWCRLQDGVVRPDGHLGWVSSLS
ncbi:FAD-dependent monooxygenase [Rhizobium leguminosarum]|uniref:FAD-dependent monooxygenase n=1 Tax=Rhizobium leguminosarum TaxID=384 RepID=UPI003F980071